MDCAEIKKYFDDYILGEIDPEIEIQINEHLLICPNCKDEIKELENLTVIFKNDKKFSPPEAVYKRIKNQLLIHRKPRSFTPVFAKRMLYLAASFFLGMVMMRTIDILLTEGKQERPAPEFKYETKSRLPFSDTVQFSPAPPKNLAQI
jgi:predicted anti-sigma-YlaC factor YlaD